MTVKQAAKYFPSTHAVDQVNVRFGVAKQGVHEWIQTAMRTASYVMTQPDGRLVYESADARFVVSENAATTISVTPLATALPVHDKVRELVSRQLRLAEALHGRECRRLNLELARRDVEVAQLRLNKQRVNNPQTKAHIERKLHAVEVSIKRLQLDVKRADEVLDTERRAARMYGVKS